MGRGLLEARLTDQGNEYRFYYAHSMSVRLIHVGTQESSARRFLRDEDVPEWTGSAPDHGTFGLRRWAENQAMASLTAHMTGEHHVVRVTIAALYEFAGDDDVPSAEGEIRDFYREHVAELLPFLRQAVHTASSQVWPVKPIMLDVLATRPGDGHQS